MPWQWNCRQKVLSCLMNFSICLKSISLNDWGFFLGHWHLRAFRHASVLLGGFLYFLVKVKWLWFSLPSFFLSWFLSTLMLFLSNRGVINGPEWSLMRSGVTIGCKSFLLVGSAAVSGLGLLWLFKWRRGQEQDALPAHQSDLPKGFIW